MHKSVTRSMQRGALMRDDEPPLRMRDIYEKHPPQISKSDVPHLDFKRFSNPESEEQIFLVITAARKNGIFTAGELSRLLNGQGFTTAIGEKWTPRLVWFFKQEMHKVKVEEAKVRKEKIECSKSKTQKAHIRPKVSRISGNSAIASAKLGDVSAALAEIWIKLHGNKK